jgi:maleylacetate reductase
MDPFVYAGLAARVIFGSGTRSKVGEELSRLNCSRALVLSTPEQRDGAQEIAHTLGGKAVGVFAQATMHTPVEITELAVAKVRSLGADCTIALGGGSTTGLGKAIALRTDLPQIVIPTTYAGSEMTPILGETQSSKKTTQRTLKVLPEVVIYDVELTLSLPPHLSATSGMNAMAHAVEALYAQDRNPIVSLMAQECVRALAHALPIVIKDPKNLEARSDALYGAWLGGTCLGLVGMALHHKLCHVLGGAFNLPHAETHTVVLPYALAYNAPAAPAALDMLRSALGVHDPAAALFELSGELGAKRSLRDLGMGESDIDKAADLAVESPYWNPRPIERDAIRSLIAQAWAGRPPSAKGP